MSLTRGTLGKLLPEDALRSAVPFAKQLRLPAEITQARLDAADACEETSGAKRRGGIAHMGSQAVASAEGNVCSRRANQT